MYLFNSRVLLFFTSASQRITKTSFYSKYAVSKQTNTYSEVQMLFVINIQNFLSLQFSYWFYIDP